jgi:hypothetical protein
VRPCPRPDAVQKLAFYYRWLSSFPNQQGSSWKMKSLQLSLLCCAVDMLKGMPFQESLHFIPGRH